MSIISRFLGIIITMYYDDHAPPHFHAKYGEYEISVQIESGVVEGKFPKRALRHVLEWADVYKDELIDDWRLAEEHEVLNKIPPLE